MSGNFPFFRAISTDLDLVISTSVLLTYSDNLPQHLVIYS